MKLLSLLAACVLFCSCQKNKQNEPGDVVARIHTKDSLANQLYALQKLEFFNGVGVAIADSSGTLFTKGFGFQDVQAKMAYTPQTVQTIGSVSKTFIGLALLKAQELGKLNVDDDASAYLPFTLRNPNYPQDKITIRHIATHTSGINDTDAYLQHNYILYGNEKGKYSGDEYMNPPSAAMADFLESVLVKGGKFNSNEVWGNYTP
ncbi:MAG: serine hydrolase domain-containing protein, partial [Flavobacterium sp.]